MDFLNYIYNRASVNQDLLRQMIGKSGDNEFDKVLFKQVQEYKKAQDKSAELINDEFGWAKNPGAISKGASNLWNTVKIITRHTPEYIADMVIKKSHKDIYEMTAAMNKYDGKDTRILDVAGMYIGVSEKTIDKLQVYLR